jgi:hypothetical protein
MFTNAPRSRYPYTAAARRFMRLSAVYGKSAASQCTPPELQGSSPDDPGIPSFPT